jgi:uncharacterized protein (TIGR00725 family)
VIHGVIAVAGPGEGATPEDCALAEEVGALIATEEAVLVCGGLGGVMEAACRGARSKLGLTVGLLPGEDREDANGWVSVAVPTGMGEMRNALIVRAADALIAVGGGWGTLSEVALAMKTGVPVVTLGWALEGVEQVPDPAAAVARALALSRPA